MESGAIVKPALNRCDRILDYIDAESPPPDSIELAKNMEWFTALFGRIPLGANLLLSGDPGVGKSTLALQLAAAAATLGQQVLYVATEQRANAVRQRFDQICGATRALRYLAIKDDLYDVSLLPQLLANQILRLGGQLYGTRLVVIDSLQGGVGVSSQDRRTWSSVLEYLRNASSAGITTLALAHMTKGRSIAGPRTLEHACDATLLLRPAASCRALIVAKNRFGPAQFEPLALTINPTSTRLEPSPIGASSTARTSSIGPGGIVEIEVAITPVRGDRGFVKAPGLCRNEIETIVDLVERIVPEARSLWALGVTVRAPDGVKHRRDHNLAVAVALIAALRRVTVSRDILFLGDLGLEGEVRSPTRASISAFEDAQAAGVLESCRRLVLSTSSPPELYEAVHVSTEHLGSLRTVHNMMEEYRG